MRLFYNEKVKNTRTLSVLGIPILQVEDDENTRIQRFFVNLFSTEKVKSPVCEKKVFKILGFPVSERIIEDNFLKFTYLKILKKQISLADDFYRKYLKNIKTGFDDVYILHSPSGEMFLFFAYLVKAVLKKNGSKTPLFVALRKYHQDILKLYFPEAHCICLDDLKLKVTNDFCVAHGHNFYMIFAQKHFQNVEKSIFENEIGEVHYFNSILHALALKAEDITEPVIHINDEVKQNVEQKIREIELKQDNFVIIAPEARTCEELPITFWEKLVQELRARNIDVFLNATNKKYLMCDCKSMPLDYQEVYCLAQKAKGVISLRSGFSEFLMSTKIPNVAIYTKFRNRQEYAFSVEKGISAFTMTKMPYVNADKIKELNSDSFRTEDELLKATIKEFDSFNI